MRIHPTARTATLTILLLAAPVLLGLLATGSAEADAPFSRRWVSAGSTDDLDRYREPYNFSLPPGKRAQDIVGMGIDGDNDHVYVWFRDGTVSAGTTDDLDRRRSLYRYSLPPGKSPSDILGMGIDGDNNHVYAWYKNGTVSAGSTDDLDKYRSPYAYSLPPGKSRRAVVGMGIDGDNNHCYVWFRDGSVSAGSTNDLDEYRKPYGYSIPNQGFPRLGRGEILAMAVDGSNNYTFAWYLDGDGKEY